MSEAEPRCFNPVAGIHYKETTEPWSFALQYESFNPVAGIHYKETRRIQQTAIHRCFNPVAGIHYKETPPSETLSSRDSPSQF